VNFQGLKQSQISRKCWPFKCQMSWYQLMKTRSVLCLKAKPQVGEIEKL